MPDSILILRSNPIAPDPRVEKIAAALRDAGYQVNALGWDRSGVLPVKEQKEGWQIWRLPIKAGFGRGMGNLPQLLRWQAGLTIWLVKHRKEFTYLHACDFDTILPALFCKYFWHKKVVYDIFDFYADHLRKTPAFIKRLIRALDYRSIHMADAVIIVDECRREQIAGSKPKRLVVVYNSPEDWQQDLQPGNNEPSGRMTDQNGSEGQPGVLHLAYIGLLQVERGLLEILDVLSHHPEWSLDLAGFGGDEPAILQKIGSMSNVAWYGRIPYDQALQLSSKADVLFATYDPAIPNHRYASPNKVFEAMMLGRPVIVAHHTNMDEIINHADCGMVVEYGNRSQLEAALTALANDPELRTRLGRNGRTAYAAVYGWHIMQDRLVQLYRQLGE